MRQDRIHLPENEPFEWSENMDFAAISDTGVIGDPTQASAEAGAKLWQQIVRDGAEATRLLADGQANQVSERWSHLPE